MKKWFSLIMAGLLAVALTLPVAADRAKSIALNRHGELKLTIGETRQLSVTFSPKNADTESVSWSSNDDEVATVDDNGLVVAVGRGDCVISVKSERGLRTSVRVTVRKEGQEIRGRELEMGIDTMRMYVDQVRTVSAYFTPSDTTDKEIDWVSSDPNVATVDAYGDVTAIAPGTTTVTGTSRYGATATCTVTVSDRITGAGQKTADKLTASANNSAKLSSASIRTAIEETADLTKKSATGYVILKNKTEITPTVMGAAAYSVTESEKDIRLRFRTETESGKLQGYITFDPRKATEVKETIGLAVYNDSKKVTTTLERFAESHNNTLTAIELSHTGSYGFAVDVVAKPGAGSELKNSDLHFYRYITTMDQYKPLEVENAYLDKNGFLHFTTSYGGVIIVSNGELAKK